MVGNSMEYTKEERKLYHIKQERIKNSRRQFDAFMSEQGWEKRHMFMRGSKWSRGGNTITYDWHGWRINGEIITVEELMRFINSPKFLCFE